MARPKGVTQAVIALWLTILLTGITEVINKWTGHISTNDFLLSIIIYSICCILPYKIGRGSNAARYFYLVLFVASLLFMLSGIDFYYSQLDKIISIVLLPVETFILYRLFQSEASSWFTKRG